jgi:hypothetical protein
MRKAASKLHWQGIGVLVVLALALGILAPLLLYSNAKADAPVFHANAEVKSVSPDTTGANGEIHNLFEIGKDPWPSLMYDVQVSFTPNEWGMAQGEDLEAIPVGAFVGTLDAVSNVGLIGTNPCGSTTLTPHFNLMNCTLDKSETVTYLEQFNNIATIADGCTKWPAFLDTLFPGMTPIARMGDMILYMGGQKISLNFMIFPPGTSLPARFNAPPFPAEKGYVAISVLNDPTGPLVIGSVTDMCPPMTADTTYFGLTKDNPRTGEDESGDVYRTNPCAPGTYTFSGYTASIRDVDADNLDNALDVCPYDYTTLAQCDPTTGAGDSDGDGLCNICDLTPATQDWDPDTDAFLNYQDNCAQANNPDQLDTDLDRIGDACDQNPTTPDGQRQEYWLPTDIEITGDDVCAAPTPTAGPGGGTPTPTTTAGTATATATVVAAVETTLAEDAAAGATEIVVADATGFAVGDAIKIGSGDSEETNTIAAIDGETITLATALEFDHAAGDPVVKVQAIVATPSPTIEGDICSPVFPGTYNGRVLVDGAPAAGGYELTASIGDTEWGSAIISGGRYAMDIPDHMPTVKPCFEGGTITFALNGMTCEPVEEGEDEWGAGIRDVDLDCAPVAPPVTPTVAPPATPTTKPPATPSPVPTKVPSTGGGGLFGTSSGLPLWATALASWVGLMAVAGLGTLVAAKRR